MEPRWYKVFTRDPQYGNPAAVIVAEGLPDAEMQALAAQLDTTVVFVLPSRIADARFRFFSVSAELPFCGHGILAAADCCMELTGQRQAKVETSVSVVTVSRHPDGPVQFETSGVSIIERPFDRREVADFLGISEHSFHPALPFCIASIGSPKLLVPVEKLAVVQSLTPDFAAISDWSARMNVNGVYVYTPETLHPDATFHARSFNPLFGVKEDAATGVAAGALAGVLVKTGCGPSTIVVEQGHNLGRASSIFVEVAGEVIKLGGFVTLLRPDKIHG